MGIKTQTQKIKKSVAKDFHHLVAHHQVVDRSIAERFGAIALAGLTVLSIAEASHGLARRIVPHQMALHLQPVVVDNGERAEIVRHPLHFQEGERAPEISGV